MSRNRLITLYMAVLPLLLSGCSGRTSLIEEVHGPVPVIGSADGADGSKILFKDPANGDYSPKGIRSPLYNAGYEDDAYLATVGATDCAGGARVMFDHIDIGAFELQKRPGLQMIIR